MSFRFPSARHPLWRFVGWGVVLGTAAVTARYLLALRHRNASGRTASDPLYTKGMLGSVGTLTEQLGPNRFSVSYQTLQGTEADLQLQTVDGRLEEPATVWKVKSPAARRQGGVWTLMGPLDLVGTPAGQEGTVLGTGRVDAEGPAMHWNKGVWEGLAPLRWTSEQGPGKGTWLLPAGWTRELTGKLVVKKGGVDWKAGGPATLRAMHAESLWTTPGFQQGELREVRGEMVDGTLKAETGQFDPAQVRWPGRLEFERADGWRGEAQSGAAPRPAPGQGFQQVELKGLSARRRLPEGEEQLSTEGARWTPAGLRLEGSVTWDQPLDGARLVLKAPRVFLREAPGPDLPESVPVGDAVAEGQPVLAWGRRSLSSPRMQMQRATRRWRLDGPVYGRGEDGTFSSGPGQGDPRSWSFQGPIVVNLSAGGNLRGQSLVWESAVWTLRGRPATWTRLRERLTGTRIVHQGDRTDFPEGLGGTLAGPEGDLSVRAEKGTSDSRQVTLAGGVECQGQGWRLLAQSVTVVLGPGRVVQQIQAKGGVSLRGRMGDGQGEALELDPSTGVAKWQGRVRGQGATPAGW